jgi:glycosyltransferase involved in cell wall biosynthesis
VRHGVELERFSAPGKQPAELAGLERPLVGCVGLVDDHMAFDAVVAVADALETGTVVLVGSVNTSPARLGHPRIALLGRRPYEEIPDYVAAFDCCLVPFANNRLTEAVNPIKLREYLAAGRPVIASPLPEVAPYAPHVTLAATPAEFAAALPAVLAPANDDAAARERRRARVADETWDRAAEQVSRLIHRLLGDVRPGPPG